MSFDYIYILGVFTEKPSSKQLEVMFLHSNNNIGSRDVIDVKMNHVSLQSDCRRCSAAGIKSACKCFTVSIFALV